ncbi:MAG: hypothetical protein JW880_03435 [Candidatus Thermoplasmatota archaeon]|nr:hypothetical protein [Candidatus Thermoplasmatota archaeon]
MPKKKPVQEKVEEVKEAEEAVEEEEQVTCPVCGKSVGLTVPSCPFCGAEFEEEAVEEIEEEVEEVPEAEQPSVAAGLGEAISEDEMAECPVCGTLVSLSVASCPSCGAEFEEEEIEEVVEVEEVPEEAPPARARPSKVLAEDEEVFVEEEVPVHELAGPPSSIADLRVIGISLIILGIIGSQISFMIDWYWTWVPPIEDNLGLFVAIAVVVVVLGLFVFMLLKRSAARRRKKVSSMVPGISLSIFLFGIFALILIMLWDPINSALQDSSLGVGGAFLAILIIGALAVFMGNRMATPKGSY